MRYPAPALVACALLVTRRATADDGPAQAASPGSVALGGRRLGEGVTFPFRPYSFVVGALSTTALARADSVCPGSGAVCPFGGGGGIFVAWGRRYESGREWLAGYDLSVRNARNLFSSATLQQLRIEHRWVLGSTPVHNFEGFVGVGAAFVLYGELLGVRTVGASLGGVAGGSYNLGAFARLGAAVRVDATRFLVPFVTGDGVLRADGGVATVTATFLISATFLGR